MKYKKATIRFKFVFWFVPCAWTFLKCMTQQSMLTSTYRFYQKSLSSAIRFLHLHRLQTLTDNPFTKYSLNMNSWNSPNSVCRNYSISCKRISSTDMREIICSREKFLYVRNVACMGSNSYMPVCTAWLSLQFSLNSGDSTTPILNLMKTQ